NGVKTVWCAQHDPVSYAPQGARAYELPSKSGKESVLVVAFLMTRPQTTEVKAAVQAAIAWYKSSAVQLKDTYYSKTEASAFRNPFIAQTGTTTWYRFYDLDQDKGFFSDRTAVKFYDIMQIEQERLAGYEWGGSYGTKLFTYSNSVGY
ncbi:pectate lyase, partial [Uliginosibacterium flavum]